MPHCMRSFIPIAFYSIVTLIGSILTLAFAPFHLWWLAIVSPALLLVLLSIPISKKSNVSRATQHSITQPFNAFAVGLCFGLGFFGTAVSWVYISLHDYGGAHFLIAGILTFLMILVLSIYIAIACYLLNRYFPQQRFSRYILAFPSLWVLAEWLRGWIFTGFPWLFLGYTQLQTPLAGFAPLISVFGISWMVASTAGLLAWVIIRLLSNFRRLAIRPIRDTFQATHPIKKNSRLLWPMLFILVIWVTGHLAFSVAWTHPDGKPMPVSIIQGNIPQTLKWVPEQAQTSLATYIRLTKKHWQSALIIWPEAALTLEGNAAETALNDLDTLSKKHQTSLITGIPLAENYQVYNGLIALGDSYGVYHKRHLVPFGEFIPFRTILNRFNDYVKIPMSDFSSGARHQPLIMVNHIPIAAFICYEIAYPTEILDMLPMGEFLVVLNDDTWFGRSVASAQHLQIAQMRALETGRYLLMSTNNGITAIINPKGEIQSQAPAFQETVLTGHIQPMSGATPWVSIGIYPVIFMIIVFLILGWIWRIPLLLKDDF